MFKTIRTRLAHTKRDKTPMRKHLTKTGWLLSGMAALYLLGKWSDRKLKKDLENFATD